MSVAAAGARRRAWWARVGRTCVWAAVICCPAMAAAQVRNWPSEGPPRPLPARIKSRMLTAGCS